MPHEPPPPQCCCGMPPEGVGELQPCTCSWPAPLVPQRTVPLAASASLPPLAGVAVRARLPPNRASVPGGRLSGAHGLVANPHTAVACAARKLQTSLEVGSAYELRRA